MSGLPSKLKRALLNIGTIMQSDLQHVMRNVIAAIVVVGLVMTPPLYAWFNTLAFWDPYSNTGNLEVAVANNDAGYKPDGIPISIEAGDEVVSALRANDQFKWVFTDEESALNSLKAGDCYAAIVIPEDFSEKLLSFLTDDAKSAEISYYTNERENAIAPKVTNIGATTLQEDISKEFTSTVIDVSLGSATDIAAYMSGNGIASVGGEISSKMGLAIQSLQTASATTEAFSVLVGASSELCSSMAGMLGGLDTTIESLPPLVEQSQRELEQVDSLIGKLEDAIRSLQDGGAIAGIAQDALGSAQGSVNSARSAIASAQSNSSQLKGTFETLSGDLTAIKTSLDETSEELSSTAASISETKQQLDDALASDDLDKVRKVLGSDTTRLATYLTSPVTLDRHAVYAMDNNGSAMSPFYTSLSLWIGCIFLIALVSTTASPSLMRRLKDPTPAQLYLGRFGIFALLALVQATIVCLGNLLFLDIQCEHPLLYMLSGWVAAFVFCNLIYTLTVVFGNVGKALAIIGLVLQIGGSGGIFPIQLSAPIFQQIYPWLPFSHSMEAFQSCMAGIYGDQLWISLGLLLAFLIPSVLFGVILARPVSKLNRKMVEKLEETEVIA